MKKKDIHIKIEEHKLSTLKSLAGKDKRKISAIIDIALTRYLKKRNAI